MRTAKIIIRKAGATLGLILLSFCACPASDGEKAAELKRALNEIAAAAQQLAERADTTAAANGRLQAQAEELKAEIRRERHRRAAVTFQQALQAKRIDYDLRLLQQVAGYLRQLDNRLSYFRTAEHTLNAYRERIHDDVRMLQILEDADIADILRQIRSVVNEYRRQCDAPLIVATSAGDPRELEILWNDIAKEH
jgi:chromosome segregation ATPase